jgi:PadR family transcriptional regulator, regulatory protein PadR
MSASLGGDLELTVLLCVVRLGEEAYGTTIRNELALRTGRAHSVGAVYTTLQRLEEKGMLTSSMGDPTPARGGRAKRYFRVTARGARAIEQARQMTDARWQGVPSRVRTT